MSWGQRVSSAIIDRRRVILTLGLFLAMAGAMAWTTMPREEDPRIPNRNALLLTPFAGADAETIERLVVEPIEEHLAKVAEVDTVTATCRADIAIVRIELHETVSATEDAWDRVEEALDDARAEFPDGVGRYDLNTRLNEEQESVVLAVTGSVDPMELRRGAEQVRRSIELLSGVAEVRRVADPGQQVTIEYDSALARRLGLAPGDLAAQLGARNQTVPAGSIRLGERSAAVGPRTEFGSLDELRDTAVILRSGASVTLRDLTTVRYGSDEPGAELMRFGGERSVALSVIPQAGIDVVALGERVRADVAELRPTLAPLEIHELSFQPDYVAERLTGLSHSLLLGIASVALILVLFMGVRLGLIVAAVVPLVALASLAIYAYSGGVLHQLSVAALILALGLLVDNAIVVAESAQQRIEQGRDRIAAAVQSMRELAFPLATATGTTVAAFVPMYMSEGVTGDFTRAIPVVAILTLVVSYVFAMTVTPVLAALLLRPRTRSAGRVFRAVATRLSRLAPRHPKKIVVGALLAVVASVVMARGLSLSFFPGADRNQFVVEVILAEGSHLDETAAAAQQIERAMIAHPAVSQVSSFIGRSAPSFYYNVPNRPRSPHFANLVIETERRGDIPAVIGDLRQLARAELPFVEVIPRRLAQGPPLAAPIEVRLSGHDLDHLHRAAEAVMAELRAIPAAVNVRHDLGIGRPTITFETDDAAAARHGLSRRDVALALLHETRGLPVGDLRSGDDPVPVLVRSSAGENIGAANLASVEIATPSGDRIPITQVATPGVEWRPAAIHRRQHTRVVTVSAQLADGATYSDVLRALEPRLAGPAVATALAASPGMSWEFGGAAEGAGDANSSLGKAAPLGMLLLFFFVLIEFNSFRRLFIILSTVPLAATGIVPGLLLSGQPFGFMSMLGVFALVGIVVNNAIVLLSVVDARRAEGASVAEALAAAVELRTRPILLTTATTVAGLIPLALSQSLLWPPMAFAMIAGLIASTALTLLVVPALYALLLRDRPAPAHAVGQLGETV
ncbi:MAG: efflux RND transporter permease subunit [Myxococcota bacterium]